MKTKSKAKAPGTIPCTCDADKRLLRLRPDQIEPFQGSLKSLAPEQQAKLAASIRELGFSFPEFVWHHPDGRYLCLDGHQRLAVLAAEGMEVEGGVPVVEIDAADEREAAKKLLVASSTYGKIEPQGLYDFTQLHGVDLLDFDLPDLPEIDMEAFGAAFLEESGVDGTPKPRQMGDRNQQVKAVLYPPDVDVFERSIRATGEQNRGAAIVAICEFYLEHHAEG